MDGLTASDDSSSEESESFSDPEERAEESFRSTCDGARRKVIIHTYRAHHLQQGRTRRSVSGSSGRLLHELEGADYATFKQRVEADLPRAVCARIASSLQFLNDNWDAPLLPNDHRFIRELGGAEDPNKVSILQQFQILFQRAATASGLSSQQVTILAEVMRRQIKYTLYRASAEFLTRTLPQEYRDQLLQWISESKLRNAAKARTAH